jgi:hypothetical protein
MEFKKYKMAMRNRISPKNRDFVIDRERAPFDDNVSNLGEQPVFSQNEFTTTPMIDPAEFPARKEYMQSYAVGGNVRQLFGGGTLPKNVQEFLIETFPDLELKFNKGLPKYGLLTNNKNYNRVLQAANNKLKNPNYVFSPDFESLKYDKNFGTAKQLLEKARSKGIYVNEKTRTDIFARNFNIKSKPNPYSSNNPPHLIYDLSSLDDPKKTEQIIKKQIQSGSYTSETGEKYLSQEEQARKKRETSAKRTEAIKEYSVPSVERGYRGTKDVNLSHMDDIFNQYTTGYTLGYAPGKINKEFLTTYDNKIILGTIGCSNTAQVSPRDKLTRVKNSIGGRIGFKEGSSCVEKGKKKIEEGKIGKSELNAVERSLEQSGKMTPDAKKYFTGAKVALKAGAKLPLELISVGFGPAGVVAGALLELATVQDDFMRGDLKEAWRNSFPGMILKGAENLVGVNITGTKETDVLKFAKTDEEIAAVKNMFSYLKGTDKYNERVEKLDRLAGDITDDVDADPEAQMISSSSAQSYYDVEEQAKKLKAILDAQEKTLGTAEGQKMSIDVLRREIASRYNRALTNVSLEQFIDDEINRIYFDIQKQAAPTPDVVDPDTQFNLMNSVRQPFAGGGLSIQDKIQELLASIPGLMMADFVPVSEKVELKRLFDQFNDRYMRKAEGGRIGFKNGPEDINKSKRLFTQLLVGLAALPIVGKYLKLGRGAAKVTNVNIPNVPGMPEFFQPLVNKVINEGIDLTTKLGTQERQIVRKADIAGHEVTVYHQLETGETDVYINGMKTLYQDAVRLHYKPGQVSEEASKASGKIVKEPDEFIAQESSPAYSGSPEDYEITSDGTFETNNFNELASDLSEVEAAVLKQPVSELQKRKKLERLKYYESKEGQQKLLDEQYGEYDDTMRDDIIDE